MFAARSGYHAFIDQLLRGLVRNSAHQYGSQNNSGFAPLCLTTGGKAVANGVSHFRLLNRRGVILKFGAAGGVSILKEFQAAPSFAEAFKTRANNWNQNVVLRDNVWNGI